MDISRGERVELSATTLENHAAKIANALRDEYALEPGAVVHLTLPLHWQLSAWCAGVWTAGCILALNDDPGLDVDLAVVDEDTAVNGRYGAVPTVAVSRHPFGLPITRELPPDVSDATLDVRSQPDALMFESTDGQAPALRAEGSGLSQSDVLDAARTLAEGWGLAAGGRLLVPADIAGIPALLAALAVPLVMEGSIVIVRSSDTSKDQAVIVAAERVTAIASPSP